MNKSKRMSSLNTLNKNTMKPCTTTTNFTSEDFHLMQMHMSFKNYSTKRELDLSTSKSKTRKERKDSDSWNVWLRKIWRWLLSLMGNFLLVGKNLNWEWQLKGRKKKEETGITKRSIITTATTMAIGITKIEQKSRKEPKWMN